ncbi:MauE/DoxX family redox-associated membrane protein [Pedobacter sp. L105]|uniref:DoxX family protein n=1 Tax=Pedobacter sp. L105 TaxID=1641871 RepID=UPI00131C746B|nr:MauE/DoxX family redox-associated membrane protein [Pedobacter sp. L105]
MNTLRLVLTWIFALILIIAGINHMIHPAMYASMIPDFLPLNPVNYFTGVIEAALGIGLLLPVSRRAAAIGTILLMIFFLPFHLADVLRDDPAIGSKLLAWIRLPLQFVLIYWAWFLVPRAK